MQTDEISKNTKKESLPLAGLWYSDVRQPAIAYHFSICSELARALEAKRKTTRGITDAHRTNEHQAIEWLIDALYQSTQCIPRVPLVLPMTRGYYTASCTNRVPMPYAAMRRILSCCEDLGWVAIQTGSHASAKLTRIVPIGFLLQYFQSIGIQWLGFLPSALDAQIQMTMNGKTQKRRPVHDQEFEGIGQWRLNLALINHHLNRQCIYLDLPDRTLKEIGQGLLNDKQVAKSLAFQLVTLRRLFTNNRFDHGGRFYGAWWQHIKSKLRRFIRINGEPTIEIDFSAMGICCLYAKEGLLPPKDPYDIGYHYTDRNDPRRAIIKKLISALLNDPTKRFRLSFDELATLGEISTKAVIERLIRYHPFLPTYLHSGIGLYLQFLDSQIAERVMLRLLEQGITCLPIHDSFIVAQSARQQLIEAMEESYSYFTGQAPTTECDEGVANISMWLLPDFVGLSDEEIVKAYRRHMDEDYSIAMNHFISWVMQTRSPQQIDQDLQTAIDKLARTDPTFMNRMMKPNPSGPS